MDPLSAAAIPRYLNLVPRPSEAIIGRDEEVGQVRARLQDGQPAVLVNGIGGIGKTTIANKYVATYETEYRHIAWVTVNSSLAEAFVADRALVESLNLSKILAELPPETLHAEGCRLILHQLTQLDDCLLILDNANDLADLLTWKAALTRCRVHVLLTSRTEPAGWKCIKIESLPREQARDLFRRYYRFQPAADVELDILLDHLDHHTLLIELCARSAQDSRIPFIDLVRRIREGYIHDDLLNARPISAGESAETVEIRRKIERVENYIELIFSEIGGLFDSESEHLKLFTLLPAAEWYPEEMWRTIWNLVNAGQDFQPGALDRLAERGWLQKEEDPTRPLAFKIHPLIQDVVTRHFQVTAAWAAAWIQGVADSIHYNSQDPQHSLFEKNQNRALAEHLEKTFPAGYSEQISHLLDRLAHLEENFGLYHAAQNLGERALDIILKIFGPEHSKVAVRQSNLANKYYYLGDYGRARDLLEAALASALKNFGPEHPNVAVYQSNLGEVYRNLGDYSRARDLLEIALASALKNFGPENPNVALRQSNLAIVYRNLGEYARARDMLEAALASDLKNFGPEHPTVAIYQSNLGNTYANLGEYARARDILEVALASDLKNFGPEHPTVALSQSNLGNVYNSLGALPEALKLFESALAVLQYNFPNGHPHVDIVQEHIAATKAKIAGAS